EATFNRITLDGLAYMPEQYQYLMENVPGREFLITCPRCEKSINFMADFINDRNPAMVFTHTPADIHPEHYATAMLVRIALKRLRKRSIRLFAFEDGSFDPVISYQPSHIVDITEVMNIKLDSTAVFVSQSRDQKTGFFREFYSAHNAFWGQQIGVKYAEAFTEFEPFLVYDCYNDSDFKLFRKVYLDNYKASRSNIKTIDI
ncbi:MAG: hypothetical protein PHV59_06255, partial [Victivallales bacterium]|nr:hypothetical protein [Victivallales bacterium]